MVQWTPNGSITSFHQLAELLSTHFVASKRERKTSIYLAMIQQAKGEDLKDYVMRFNHEVVLIPDLHDEVEYTIFLNGLLPGMFKFSLAESKVATLAQGPRRAQDFIQAIEMCAGDDFILLDNRKRGG